MEKHMKKEDIQNSSSSIEHKKKKRKRKSKKIKMKNDTEECICQENEPDLPKSASLEDTMDSTVSIDGQTLCTPQKDYPAPEKQYQLETTETAPSERNNENMNLIQATSAYNLTRGIKTYSLENFESNIMIIFNHTEVIGFPNRESCKYDVDNLKNTFEKYKFHSDNIHVHPDLTHHDLTIELNKFFARDFTAFGCVVVVVLTHGDDGGYLRAKDRDYHESELIDPIINNGIATLAQKPKIFIIQACRGEKTSNAAHVGKHTEDKMDGKDKKPRVWLDKTMLSKTKEADVLIVHSTFAGVISHGDKKKGSWLIQSLCRNIDKYVHIEHFVDILTRVKNDVAINKGREMTNQETGQKEIHKQMIVVTSNLKKKLYFKNISH